MAGALIDALYTLARLMEAECEALVGGHAPDALGMLAAAKARLFADLDSLGAADSDPALADAVAALRDCATMQVSIIGDRLFEKSWPSEPNYLRRV